MSEQRRLGPLGWIVRNPRRIVFWYLLTLPLQYVASTGPVLWLLRKGVLPNGASSIVVLVYTPLQWLYDHIGLMKALFDWYLPLFPSP